MFLQDANLPRDLSASDLVAIMNCGAYGFSMANRYNSRPLPAEVLVDGETWKTVGRRENLDDALKREIV